MSTNETMTLYRPASSDERDLVRQSGFRAFPPRLPEQPIFDAVHAAIVGVIEIVAKFGATEGG